MRLFSVLVLTLTCLSPFTSAQDFETADVPKEKHNYQSDVARLRRIVINSLYSHKEIFLRELISNANDAIEKLRLLSLTDKSIYDGTDPLNITVKVAKDEDGKGGRLIITDTGIGMTPQELATNLGTLAKSGTSDFLKRAENDDGTNTGNLIGSFGLGFYSSFLVADKVYVASLPPKTPENPNPVQHVFSSSADESAFEIFPDPRGNTLGRGTEIILELKPDSLDYLNNEEVTKLINKHSVFSSAFPIYLHEWITEEVPDEDAETPAEDVKPAETPKTDAGEKDEDEAIVEDANDEKPKEPAAPKMKQVTKEHWAHLNPALPIWMRDPKDIDEEEYTLFYNAFWRDFSKPLAWQHFSAETGSGTPFKAILYLPGRIDDSYWQQPLESTSKDIKLMVKRVFITSDFGEDALPKWASWVKVVVDAEDLPLNVSRETLQSTKFLKQIKQVILKRLIQLFSKIAEEDPDKWEKVQKVYNTVLKIGSVEDTKNRDKLVALTRYHTNQRNATSLDDYIENKKKGQKQIFYLAEMSKSAEQLAKSIFVEKLHARGYEVLLLNEPLDEILVQNLRKYKNMPFQDIAKVGLKFGDEEEQKEEKALLEEMNEKYQPLMTYLKEKAQDVVRDVVISNRLVQSPCAVVADTHGYTANVQKMMSASNSQSAKNFMHEFAMKAKLLEINPRSPLIEGLLKRVQRLPEDKAEWDLDDVAELDEITFILIDGALVRSGFEVPDSNEFFSRVDRVLRRSLGVSETAPTDTTVKPAPPVDSEPIPEELPFEFQPESNKPGIHLPDHMKDQIQIEMEEIDDDGNVVSPPAHDEL